MRCALVVCLVCLLALLSERARAGNDDSILLGNDAALTGGAVTAWVNDGSSLWYNPAGLSLARKDSVDVGASAFALRKYKIPKLLSADDGSRADASFTEFLSIPSALTFVRRFGERFTGGLGLFTSQQGDFTLRTALSPSVPQNELATRFNTLFTSEGAIYHLGLGLGYRVLDRLHVGVSLFGDYGTFVESTRQSWYLDVAGTVLAHGVDASLVEESVLGFHAALGLLYQVTDELSVGLSLQTPGFYFHRSTHTTSISSTAVDGRLAEDGVSALAAESLDERESKLALGQYAPVRVRLGVALRALGGTFSLEGDLQSKVKDRDVGVDRQLSWNLRAGGRVPWGERFVVGAGFFTDRDGDRASAPAKPIHFYGGTLGGEYISVRGANGSNDAGSGLTFTSTLALRYALGSGRLPGTHLRVETFESEPVGRAITVHELTLHIGSGLYF